MLDKLFDVPDVPSPQELARQALQKANQKNAEMLRESKADLAIFWSGLGADPVSVIEAMGTNAASFFQVAYARVVFLKNIAEMLGKPELVNVAEFLPPYDLTFKEDGSLLAATPKGPQPPV